MTNVKQLFVAVAISLLWMFVLTSAALFAGWSFIQAVAYR
jgi:hypothetical protein